MSSKIGTGLPIFIIGPDIQIQHRVIRMVVEYVWWLLKMKVRGGSLIHLTLCMLLLLGHLAIVTAIFLDAFSHRLLLKINVLWSLRGLGLLLKLGWCAWLRKRCMMPIDLPNFESVERLLVNL